MTLPSLSGAIHCPLPCSPVLSGALFQCLVTGQPFQVYSKLLSMMVIIYVVEPLLTQVYIRQMCAAGEHVQAALRIEAFRTLLMQRQVM